MHKHQNTKNSIAVSIFKMNATQLFFCTPNKIIGQWTSSTIILSAILLISAQSLFAQKITTNASGEKIVRYDDGSWRFYEPGDSVLATQATIQTEVPNPTNNTNVESKVKENQKTNSEAVPQPQSINSTPYKSYNESIRGNLLDHPPAYNCQIAREGVDEYTKKKVTELQRELFFTYTDKQVAPYLKGKNYITCEAYLSKFATGQMYLQLRITVASKTARIEYGVINQGSQLSVKLIDGEIVNLYSAVSDGGVINENTNETIYRVGYAINRDNQKVLRNALVDAVRLTWSTGYEEYEVTNLDFFQNQLDCLKHL